MGSNTLIPEGKPARKKRGDWVHGKVYEILVLRNSIDVNRLRISRALCQMCMHSHELTLSLLSADYKEARRAGPGSYAPAASLSGHM